MKVVIGLGKTGVSCVAYLLQRGERVHVVDTRLNPPGLEALPHHPHLTLQCGELSPQDFHGATEGIISPGIAPAQVPHLPSTLPLVSDIELFARVNVTPVIAITGSNGKTTVTTLVGQLLQAVGLKVGIGGNIGRPALTLLTEPYDIIVLELSSFQLETTHSLRVLTATVLNISSDHLDRHHTLENYIRAKLRIFRHADHVIINRQEVYGRVALQPHHLSFGINACPAPHFGVCEQDGALWLAQGSTPLLPVAHLPLQSEPHIANVLAALALVSPLALPQAVLNDVLRTFQGLPHRAEVLGMYQDILWVNDSKATNVGATLATLNGLACMAVHKWVLILDDFKVN